MFPHQIHDALRSDARFAIQRPEHHRARRRCCHPAPRREPLRPEQKSCRPTVVRKRDVLAVLTGWVLWWIGPDVSTIK